MISTPRQASHQPEPGDYQRSTLHGVLVSVLGSGVLIVGDAGVGKSACALELLSRGHWLVADDVVEIEREGDAVVGSAPERFAGVMHVRGLGLFNVRELFGETAWKPRCEIGVCIELCGEAVIDPPDPFADGLDHAELLGLSIPKFTLLPGRGNNLAVLIETSAKLAVHAGFASQVEEVHDALPSRSTASQGT